MATNVQLRDYGLTDELICPRCGSEYLHHGTVELFQRSEDEAVVIRTVATGRSASVELVQNEASGNPSSRRHGLMIEFECENCPPNSGPLWLTVAQHKGCTELGWRYDKAAAEAARIAWEREKAKKG